MSLVRDSGRDPHRVPESPWRRLRDNSWAGDARRPTVQLALVTRPADRSLEVVDREPLAVAIVTAAADAEKEQQSGEDYAHVP